MFRIQRKVSLGAEAKLNISKSRPTLTLGPKGFKLTLGTDVYRVTIGIPGTGLYWSWWIFRDEQGSWKVSRKPPRIKRSEFAGVWKMLGG